MVFRLAVFVSLLALSASVQGWGGYSLKRTDRVPMRVKRFLDEVLEARASCNREAFFETVANNYRIIGQLQEQDAEGFFTILEGLCTAFPGITNQRTSVRRIAPSSYVLGTAASDANNGFMPFNIISVYTLRETRRGFKIVTEVITARVSDYQVPFQASPP